MLQLALLKHTESKEIQETISETDEAYGEPIAENPEIPRITDLHEFYSSYSKKVNDGSENNEPERMILQHN